MLIEVEPGGLTATAPPISSLADNLLSTLSTVSSACDSAAGAAGHPSVEAALESFLGAGTPALSNLSAAEEATSSRVNGASSSYVANDNSVMGG